MSTSPPLAQQERTRSRVSEPGPRVHPTPDFVDEEIRMAAQRAAKEVATPMTEREKALETALAQIERQFGKGSVMRLGQEERVPVEVIPTGSIALDIALGIGGLPRGRIVEIFGPESSGKTTLVYHVIAEAQRKRSTDRGSLPETLISLGVVDPAVVRRCRLHRDVPGDRDGDAARPADAEGALRRHARQLTDACVRPRLRCYNDAQQQAIGDSMSEANFVGGTEAAARKDDRRAAAPGSAGATTLPCSTRDPTSPPRAATSGSSRARR